MDLSSLRIAGGSTLVRSRVGPALALLLLRGLRLVYRERPAPLGAVAALARMAGNDNEALLRAWERKTRGRSGSDAWAMHPDAVDLLEGELRQQKPSCVLEFGSGSSTVWIASVMREIHGDAGGSLVLSIEQDEEVVSSVSRRLRDEGLERSVRFLVAPLVEQVVWGRKTIGYEITAASLAELLESARPDFVVIDGPAGEPGARFPTLPLVIDHVAVGAPFFLDDALRQGELWAAGEWATSKQLKVAGVHLIGRGVATGRLESDSS